MAWSKDHGKVAKVNADYAKVQGDYAQTEANKVEQFIEDNKTKWLPAVATVAARNSAYPNPEHGDTVRVTSEAKTYRYVSPTGWVVTDIYDASAIDQVTTQLAQTVNKDDTGILDLNIFDEPTRNVLQGQEIGTINAVLGLGNVKTENLSNEVSEKITSKLSN